MSESQSRSAASESEHDRLNQTYPAAPIIPDLSGAVPTSTEARAKRRIAALEDELQQMKQEKGKKKRKTTYYIAQGRAIRRTTVLYSSLEDLIAENDCRYEEVLEDGTVQATTEQDRFQRGYLALTTTLPWLHPKLASLDVEDCEDMLRKVSLQLKKGADAARGDDTSTLKDLIAAWVNEDFRPSPLLRSDSKQLRGFTHDVCGKLLCPAKWDWSNDRVRAGIRDRTSDHIVSENSWPLFVYENYRFFEDVPGPVARSRVDKLLEWSVSNSVIAYVFRANHVGRLPLAPLRMLFVRCAKMLTDERLLMIFFWQVRFALSSVSSWRTVDGDFDYEAFWNNTVDFFEDVPGPVARSRVDKLL
ncbi:hypothetical protein P692DRAFT_201729316, partial [Suillus brevipes Sb2]